MIVAALLDRRVVESIIGTDLTDLHRESAFLLDLYVGLSLIHDDLSFDLGRIGLS